MWMKVYKYTGKGIKVFIASPTLKEADAFMQRFKDRHKLSSSALFFDSRIKSIECSYKRVGIISPISDIVNVGSTTPRRRFTHGRCDASYGQ